MMSRLTLMPDPAVSLALSYSDSESSVAEAKLVLTEDSPEAGTGSAGRLKMSLSGSSVVSADTTFSSYFPLGLDLSRTVLIISWMNSAAADILEQCSGSVMTDVLSS